MDTLLRRGKFWVDSIYEIKNDFTTARIIPDIKSEYFPPWHTRTIEFPTHFLEERFFKTRMRSNRSLEPPREEFTGEIVQGQYYDISRQKSRLQRTISGFYSMGEINLSEAKADSPVSDGIDWEPQGADRLSGSRKRGKEDCRLYCFNVGQGDSSLLVVNGNAYLIDTNIYARDKLSVFVEKIRNILQEEDITLKIKALVITHKHTDHLRGAHKLLSQDTVPIESLIMNHLYKHPITTVRKVLDVLEKKFPVDCRIDASKPFTINEGKYVLDFINPTEMTNSNDVAPDINDSSIVITVRNREESAGNIFVLTGDASFPVIEDCLTGIPISQSILKVSHHGSKTGTGPKFVSMINPEYASISAGRSSNDHPDLETLEYLGSKLTSNQIFLSEEHKKTVKCDLATMKCVLI